MTEKVPAVLESTLTCPRCGHAKKVTMPIDYCLYFYTCSKCRASIRPLEGDCCVFCSFGDVPCPPRQTSQR